VSKKEGKRFTQRPTHPNGREGRSRHAGFYGGKEHEKKKKTQKEYKVTKQNPTQGLARGKREK